MRTCLTMQPAAWLLIWVVMGCGSRADKWSKARPAVYRVSGKVFLDGEPVKAANINFIPGEGTYAAYALTDDRGNFRLSTFQQGDGAPDGTYRVTVRKTIQESTPDPRGLDFPPLIVKETAVVPARYSDPDTSGLTAKVTNRGTTDLRFDLKH